MPLIRYLWLSVLGYAFNCSVNIFLNEVLHWNEALSAAISYTVLFIFYFFGCRLYVYQSKATAPVRQAIEFAAASFGFRLVEYLCFLFLTFVLNFHYLLSVSLISCIFTVLKHFVYERTIFSDSAKLGPTGSANTTFSAAQGDK